MEANNRAPRPAQVPYPNLFGQLPNPTYPQTPGWKGTDTSREAALAIACQAKTLRANVLRVLMDEAPNALSADQIAIRLQRSPFSIRPRVSELAAAGLIEPAPARIKNDSGMTARTWRAAA